MAMEFALESSVDLSSSQETGADNLAWFIEHSTQLGMVVGEALVLLSVIYGLVKGLEAVGGAISKKPQTKTADA